MNLICFTSNGVYVYRSLVQKLEKVDPSRLKREEKLAFWINIHNALTMHVSKHLMDKASIFY